MLVSLVSGLTTGNPMLGARIPLMMAVCAIVSVEFRAHPYTAMSRELMPGSDGKHDKKRLQREVEGRRNAVEAKERAAARMAERAARAAARRGAGGRHRPCPPHRPGPVRYECGEHGNQDDRVCCEQCAVSQKCDACGEELGRA